MTTTLPLPMPHSQRLRFIRSMKKLGDLLTETQSVLTVTDGVTAGHRRAASSFSHASESSTPTPGTNTSFLSFRLPKSPLSLSPRPATATSPATPLTPAAIDPAKLQAHNLAKASAMLGEDVPPELVPFSQRNQDRARARANGRKRSSTVSVPEFSTATAAAVNVDLDASAGRVARDRRSHTAAGAHGKTQAPRSRPSRTTLKLKHAASSASLQSSFQSSLYDAADAEPFSYATLVAASTVTAAVPVPVPVLFAPAPAQTQTDASRRTTYRKEAAWSGEWSGSVRSMEDVVRGLRELRV